MGPALLLPQRSDSHSLGCHRPRIPDRVVFEKLVPMLRCRLPETWDHPEAVLARNMGPGDGVVGQELGTTR